MKEKFNIIKIIDYTKNTFLLFDQSRIRSDRSLFTLLCSGLTRSHTRHIHAYASAHACTHARSTRYTKALDPPTRGFIRDRDGRYRYLWFNGRSQPKVETRLRVSPCLSLPTTISLFAGLSATLFLRRVDYHSIPTTTCFDLPLFRTCALLCFSLSLL